MKEIVLDIAANEEIVLPIIWVNNDETEISIKVKMLGNNSTLTIVGIFYGDEGHSVICNTDVTHVGKNTKSLTTIRCVMKDTAYFNNDGMIRIQKGAKNTNGYFQSKILLFDDAKGRSVPSLEIDENEVKAGHGSTIGRPDPTQLFYMQSRGLPEEEATRLIISGFFEPIIELLSEKDRQEVRQKLRTYIQVL
jgi:Fe-S cluster assembly protein SufD